MNPNFFDLYEHKDLLPEKLHEVIVRKYISQGYDVNKMLDYQQILYILDKVSQPQKANRSISEELFKQSQIKQKSSISKMVWSYIQNIQTSKICILRDQKKTSIIQKDINNIQIRNKTFVFLRIVQASIYSRFSKEGSVSYAIVPSDIPPVFLTNAISPKLNHQFTLQLQDTNQFTIVFMDSGIKICEWVFPDVPNLEQGEYNRVIRSQNLTFEVKIKYMPKNSQKQKKKTENILSNVKQQQQVSMRAFKNLCYFKPFLKDGVYEDNQYIKEEVDEDGILLKCFPFLKKSILFLHILLVIYILLESILSYYSSIQFLDIILAFYILGLLYDREITSYSSFGITFFLFAITVAFFLLKSFWGLANPPSYNANGVRLFAAFLCVIVRILLIIVLLIISARTSDLARQREEIFYSEYKQEFNLFQSKEEQTIWQDKRRNDGY